MIAQRNLSSLTACSLRTSVIGVTRSFPHNRKAAKMASNQQVEVQQMTFSHKGRRSRNTPSISPRDDLQAVARSFKSVSIASRSRPVSDSRAQIVNSFASPTTTKKNRTSARELREAKVQPSKASGGIPNPTAAYLAASNTTAMPLQEPQHLLVVIDLNGTLLHRPNKKQPTKFIARPNTSPFLKYCIDTFTVVIWSSARPENVKYMCDSILSTKELKTKVAAIWARDKFNLSISDYNLRVQCYKRLTTVWKDPKIATSHPLYESGARWDQTNTVLVDDSLEKGRSEPFNLIEIPEFGGNDREVGEILPQVHDYLNYLSMHSNVSACGRTNPFKALMSP
jgi:hypothetical protein